MTLLRRKKYEETMSDEHPDNRRIFRSRKIIDAKNQIYMVYISKA